MSSYNENSTFIASPSHNLVTPQDYSVKKRAQQAAPKILRIHPVDAGAKLRAIDSEKFVFGRDEKCQVVVEEHSASRRHAKIIQEGEHWFVVDLGSTNGTWVNEESVQIQRLESGDRVRIGRWIYKFFIGDNVEANYHESVYQMMTQDTLTGAWNKRYLKDILEREILQHRRTRTPLGLLMIDFDGFKEINDNHGHQVGDEVLAEFGRRMIEAKRASEVFARFGGDEFAVILLNSDHKASKLAAERLFNAVVDAPFVTSKGSFDCSISGGFVVCDADNKFNGDEFLKAADQKLYEAKKAGRNQIIG